LRGCQAELDRRLLRPLGMRRTFLRLPHGTRDVARGYETALAGLQVVAGQIAGVTLASPGGLHAGAPLVQVRGGGTGAAIAAAGSGYTAPATVAFSGAGATMEAKAVARIEAGRVAAVAVIDGGTGYFRTPQVTIAGGRTAGGADATATVLIANGQVVHVQVDSPGAGYLPPLSIAVAPGDTAVNAVPV
jgi:hypothetical protein